MGRVVYLHVGAPKTGTTYLQDRLSRNAKTLARHGVRVPTSSPLVSPALFHFRAALDLLGQDWGGEPGHAEGAWEALVKRIRRSSGTYVVSHEILAPASAEQVERAMSDLDGCEVHVVYSARDLGRALPAAWQESIKQGRRWTFRRFLRLCETGTPWFIRAFDLPAVLGTWGAALPPSRVHVVTVPQRGRPLADDSLWLRFCRSFAIDPDWAPVDSDRSNPSLGMAETQLLRQLNKRLGRHPRRRTPYDAVVHEQLVPRVLGQRQSAPVRLPPAAHDWVEERTGQWLEHLVQSGVDVIGELDDLRPVWPDPEAAWRNPDRVSARRRLGAAVDALAAMTEDAAQRPASYSQLAHKVRANAHRLRIR